MEKSDKQWPADKIERRKVADLIPYARNSRTHSEAQIAQIAASIREWGWTTPVLIDPDSGIIAGHARVMAAQKLGIEDVPCMVANGWSDAQKRAYIIADNKLALGAEWDEELLKIELEDLMIINFDLEIIGFGLDELDNLFDEPVDGASGSGGAGSLAERFMIPPFSVLNAREGWWQDRKRAWLATGIKSELGREDLPPTSVPKEVPDYMAARGNNEGGSIFDPVLCELVYTWFSPKIGTILDPFAGGSVRGIVASKLGRDYTGHELSKDQVEANRIQADDICWDGPLPVWIVGDSLNIGKSCKGVKADMVFSCPPYADLEVYSDDPRDLSTMTYAKFKTAYFKIIDETCKLLKDDRFACFVVGEVRDKKGNYLNFVGDTVEAFKAAGLKFYNEAILITSVGSLPIRVGRQFEASRKLGKTHQNVLVFVKGDGKKATEACGAVEYGEVAPEANDDPQPALPTLETCSGNTPFQDVGDGVWFKRDDLFEVAGVRGGKVRSCWRLAQGATGLVTAGSISSPQVNIVAHVANQLGIPCRVHTPQGKLSPEVAAARDLGAEVVQHKAGYNSVIIARARDDAAALGWKEIPFGMECKEAVEETAAEVKDFPDGLRRLVVTIGSGMSLSGILHGMAASGYDIPVLGVVVGADPEKRLDKWAPKDWRDRVTLVPAGMDYQKSPAVTEWRGIKLDPIYEAKCLPFLEPGDLFWIVGIRQTAV